VTIVSRFSCYGRSCLRVGFVVPNLTHPAERMVMFHDHCGTAEQHIKEGKNVVT